MVPSNYSGPEHLILGTHGMAVFRYEIDDLVILADGDACALEIARAPTEQGVRFGSRLMVGDAAACRAAMVKVFDFVTANKNGAINLIER